MDGCTFPDSIILPLTTTQSELKQSKKKNAAQTESVYTEHCPNLPNAGPGSFQYTWSLSQLGQLGEIVGREDRDCIPEVSSLCPAPWKLLSGLAELLCFDRVKGQACGHSP